MSKKFIDVLAYDRIIEAKEADKTVRVEFFDRLKNQWKDIQNRNYKGMDYELVELVGLFNNIPGVATTWCCSGHYENKGEGLVRPPKTQTTHIGFVTKEEKHPIYESIADVIRAFPVQAGYDGVCLSLNSTSLLDKFRDRDEERGEIGANYVSYFLQVSPIHKSPMSTEDYVFAYTSLYRMVVKRTLELMSEGKM